MAFTSKTQLRTHYTQKRFALSEQQYCEANRRIYDQFFAHITLSSIYVLHSFVPILSKREPNTEIIIGRIKKDFSYIRICIPKVNFAHNRLESIHYTGQPLTENKWGVKEPTRGLSVAGKEIDAVIVPLLVFDTAGHRVGYGKGYYDHFLAACRKDCKKIGLSLFPPVEKIQHDNRDIRLNCCITPERIYQFNNA